MYLPLAALGGAKRQLLSAIAGNPVLHTEWLWAAAFNFAVSSSYLQAEELACIRDVVVTCLTEFARYMAGVGISGEWPVEGACISRLMGSCQC
jgi:hypothetical protein